MMLKRISKWLVITLVVLFLAIQFVRPARTNPAVDESQTIFARTQMTPPVAAILDRSCRDCHSNKTVWPWYTNVAPVSWFIVNHVNEARPLLNFSEWGKLDRDRQSKKLQQICDEVSDGGMPYTRRRESTLRLDRCGTRAAGRHYQVKLLAFPFTFLAAVGMCQNRER